LNYIEAGCPAVCGTLWVVTDKEIDKLALYITKQWIGSNLSFSLLDIIPRIRNECRYKYLTGASFVYYGLPGIYLKKKKKL